MEGKGGQPGTWVQESTLGQTLSLDRVSVASTTKHRVLLLDRRRSTPMQSPDQVWELSMPSKTALFTAGLAALYARIRDGRSGAQGSMERYTNDAGMFAPRPPGNYDCKLSVSFGFCSLVGLVFPGVIPSAARAVQYYCSGAGTALSGSWDKAVLGLSCKLRSVMVVKQNSN